MTTTPEIIEAAGVALLSGGKVLLLKRGDGGDYPGHWSFPGGKAELGEGGDSAARRECLEETGFIVPGAMRQLGMSDNGAVRFTTFGRAVSQFDPVLCSENVDFMWAAPDDLPEPMHPGTKLFLDGGAIDAIDPNKMNELDVARAMAAGEMTSPQRFGNMALFALRITGTGMAFRRGLNEHVWRDPALYLNDNFLQRCNGLMVIYEHPEKNILNSKEFARRTVGAILLPYLQGDEVWGIAKIYDDDAIALMTDPEKPLSTSPAVVFRIPEEDNVKVMLEDGRALLIEGEPSLLDHLAVCPQGVWDKGGEPTGVLLNNDEATKMSDKDEEAKAKADAEASEKAKADSDAGNNMKAIMDSLGSLAKRMDSMEAASEPKKVAADSDDEEAKKAKADADEKAKEEQAKADSQRIDTAVAAAMAAQLPRQVSDADQAIMADAQARADSVASAFGNSAPRPLQGESPLGYRKRLLGAYREHSKAWKGVDLTAITDESVISIAETQIYADAMMAAANPVMAEGEGLREIQKRSPAGHQISTFVGNPASWTSQFKLQARRVQNINKGA